MRLYNYDDDPADASLVEAWLQHKRDSEYDDMADGQGQEQDGSCVPYIVLLVIVGLVVLGLYLAITSG